MGGLGWGHVSALCREGGCLLQEDLLIQQHNSKEESLAKQCPIGRRKLIMELKEDW